MSEKTYFTKNDSQIAEGQLIELSIEKLLYGGQGFSHYGSIACLVSDVIPDETVIARINAIKKHYLTAALNQICKPSPRRIAPLCNLFTKCGGCQWQHIEYSHQLYWKAMIIKECLERIADIQDPPLLPPIPSPSIFHYRSRASFKTHFTDTAIIGYYQRGTHYIIPVQECPLLLPPLNQALERCRILLNRNKFFSKDISDLNLLLINTSNQVLVTFNTKDSIRLCVITNAETISQLTSIYDSTAIPAHEYVADEELMGISFKRRLTTFYQVNSKQNSALIQLVINYFQPINDIKILDLYCGCGNFSLFLAREGAQIVGIDANPFAIAEALHNAKSNKITDCTYVTGDTETMITQFVKGQFDGILINPPRSGCSKKTIKTVITLHPRVIVYVSCNPATLARDLKEIIRYGYCIEKIQPIDMFPQTFHVETVVKMIK